MTAANFDPDWSGPAEWAAMYREHNIQVVPAYAPDPKNRAFQWKRPALTEWKALQDQLVPDLTFARWYGATGEHSTRSQMGILTGQCSGNLGVIDLDIQRHATAAVWWQGLLAENRNGIDFETWEQVTGGGGLQLVFRFPQGFVIPTIKTGIGVDIRGQGGFAMLPPSRHESGKLYAWKEGMSPHDIAVEDAPEWLCDAIMALWEEFGSGSSPVGRVKTAALDRVSNDFGFDVDGREDKMMRMIWARLVDLRRESPIISARELEQQCAEAFAVYERAVSSRLHTPGSNAERLEQEGRGWSEFQRKWKYAAAKWDARIAEDAGQPKPGKTSQQHDPFDDAPKGDQPSGEKAKPKGVFEFLDIAAIKSLPDPKWLVGGLVVENATGFIYGPPGCGKTFVALSMALSLTVAMPDWWGRKIERSGSVIYISSEGQGDMKFRIAAWEHTNQVLADGTPFYLIRETINFMNADDVAKLVATVDAIVADCGTAPVAVFVDTVSRVLPGADENLQKDMTLFIAACDAVRQKFKCSVIGIHHTSRAGNMRGSTVFDGAGDFLLGVEREEGAEIGSIKAKKIKAAADGWEEAFRLVAVNLGVEKTSLVAVPTNEQPKAEKAKDGWPDRDVCRRILVAIDRAWADGKPFSSYPNTAKAGRYIVNFMIQEFNLPRKLATEIVETWLLPDRYLAVEIRDAKSHTKGLKVVSWDGF